MDQSRFAGIFSRRRRPSSDEKKGKTSHKSAGGAHELHLDFLRPGNPRARRPPTSILKRKDHRASDAYFFDDFEPPDSITRSSTSHEKPRKSFSAFSGLTANPRSLPIRVPSRRKKSFLSFSRSAGDELEDDAYNRSRFGPGRVEHDCASRPSTSGWLRRRVSSTFRSTPRPYTPSTLLPSYNESPYIDGCLPAPVPEFGQVPGFGYAPPRQRGDLSSGAAARAAAAAQNELLESMRIMRLTEPVVTRDSESGVGIEVRDRGEGTVDSTIPVVRQNPVVLLPTELMAHVLSYLDASSLLQAELVSRDWFQLASSRHIWKQIFRTEFQESASSNVARHGRTTQYQDWKSMWKARKALHQRWLDGYAAAIYLEGHTDSVYCVQFDKDKILTGSRDRTVRIWDARTYECIKVLGVTSREVGASLPPLLADGSGHRPFTTVIPHSTQNTPTADWIPFHHTGSILCLQFDDEIMVTGSSDRTLIVWDVKANYTPIWQLRNHTAGVLDVCFDAKYIVSCSKDTTIRLWDRRTGDFLRTLSGHRGPVNAVQLRGDLVVSASGDGIAKLWNLTSGLCIKEFLSKDRGMACVEFSIDSRTILAGGNDQVVYQFDTNSGELVRELKGHEGLVRSLHLDSDSGRVISGSYDTSVKAFDLRTGKSIVDFKRWTSSWILSAKADYRRIIATSQDSRAVIMDFGYLLPGIESLEA